MGGSDITCKHKINNMILIINHKSILIIMHTVNN